MHFTEFHGNLYRTKVNSNLPIYISSYAEALPFRKAYSSKLYFVCLELQDDMKHLDTIATLKYLQEVTEYMFLNPGNNRKTSMVSIRDNNESIFRYIVVIYGSSSDASFH